MAGIPPDMHRQLRQTLLDCVPFGDDNQLRAMFAHPTLKPWRHSVPQASNPADRVDAAIAFLVEKHRADTKENALVLLLRAASERLDPGDECHTRLVGLASELEQVLGGGPPASQTPLTIDSTSVQASVLDAETIAEIRELVREDQLDKALNTLLDAGANQNEVDQLIRRLNRVRRRELLGILTGEEADSEYAKIADAILDLISS